LHSPPADQSAAVIRSLLDPPPGYQSLQNGLNRPLVSCCPNPSEGKPRKTIGTSADFSREQEFGATVAKVRDDDDTANCFEARGRHHTLIRWLAAKTPTVLGFRSLSPKPATVSPKPPGLALQ